MAKDYGKLAKNIVKLIGGSENVKSLTHCITRLRFVLKDESKAKTADIENLTGVVSVIKAGGQYQVVIGSDVHDVYEEVGKIKGIDLDKEDNSSNESNGKKKGFLSALVDVISGVFMPCMKAMVAAGLIKAILIMLSIFGVLSTESTTYTLLYAIGDGFFYFMPFFLGASVAKKFGSDSYLGMAVAAAFLYPSITELFNTGAEVSFIGIPVNLISYPTSVLPILVAVYVMTKVEKMFKKIIPKILAGTFVPVFTLLVTIPLSFIVIGPVTNTIGTIMANGITTLMALCPPVTGFIIGALWSVFIMVGMHWAFIPIGINNFITLGYDTILPITFPCTLAHAGSCLGVAFKSKDKKVKEVSMSAFFSAFIGGISEPAIYGINLKYKKPFIIACIANGIGGAVIATAGGQMTEQVSVNVFTLPVVATFPAGMWILISIAIGFFGSFIGTYLFGYKDQVVNDNKNLEVIDNKNQDKELMAPMNGELISIKEVNDDMFSKGVLGEGIAIIPENGEVYSPCDGIIRAAYPHAIGIETTEGIEVLVHLGIDTVKLNGKYFELKVKEGDRVSLGDKLLKADIESIKNEGYDVTTMMIVTNKNSYSNVKVKESKRIRKGEVVLSCICS